VRIFAFHKPRGVVTSTVEEGGAAHVFSLLPEEYRGWYAVGRLDKESEGLLLFCDDAKWAQRLMDPGGASKTYEVVVEGFPRDEALGFMREGGHLLDGRALRPVEVERLGKAPRGGTRLRVVLHEGVNREIRRLFRAAGHKVRKLVRVAVGPVALGSLEKGKGRELSGREVEQLAAESSGGIRPKRRTEERDPGFHLPD
jgi:23S rRNA pseudouridine2605 synthase